MTAARPGTDMQFKREEVFSLLAKFTATFNTLHKLEKY